MERSRGIYPVIVISVAAWYGLETFAQINSTFGDPDSEKFMNWTVVNGGPESIILENGSRGDIVEYYSAQLIPLVLVIDHEGYVVAKENTGTPLDRWGAFDNAVLKANEGDAEDLRIGIAKSDRSVTGVFIIGLFLGVLVYFSPCAFPVLPSYITYYLSLGMREEELHAEGKDKREDAWFIRDRGLCRSRATDLFRVRWDSHLRVERGRKPIRDFAHHSYRNCMPVSGTG